MPLALITIDFIAKLLIIAVFTPMWLPIVKELWNEVNESLVDEGGVLGKDADEQEAQRVLRERAREGASLVSDPVAGPGSGRRSSARPQAGGRRGRARPAPKRRGF
jgi:hypothetical protein